MSYKGELLFEVRAWTRKEIATFVIVPNFAHMRNGLYIR